MKTKIRKALHSPWFTLALVVSIVTVGYTFVLFQNPEAMANGAVCTGCTGPDCPHS